ncbi:MAG: SAF domain-containing protein [Bacilli bacterium]
MILEFIKGNKYLTRDQQMKRQLIKGLLIGVIVLGILFALYSFLYVPKLIQKERSMAIESYFKQEQITAYVLAKDLKQGEMITKEALLEVKVPRKLAAADMVAVLSQTENTVARMDLKTNTVLSQGMVLPKEDNLSVDLRKQDYSHIALNSNLKQGDWIDIRFKKKNGDDYIVASKKKVLYVNGNIMILNIRESERQFINNATVKAAHTDGTVYTTIYVDPENQAPAKVTYQLDWNIDSLIKDNPNVVTEAEQEIANRNNPSNNTSTEEITQGGN